jgi:hypothetical protein
VRYTSKKLDSVSARITPYMYTGARPKERLSYDGEFWNRSHSNEKNPSTSKCEALEAPVSANVCVIDNGDGVSPTTG